MKKTFSRQRGFSLVEVALAMSLASFCIITLAALMTVGITTNKDSLSRTTASALAVTVVSDLRVRSSAGVSPQYQLTVPPGAVMTGTPAACLFLDENGKQVPTDVAPALFRVSLYYMTPAAGTTSPAPIARVQVTWPALADSNPGTAPSRYSDSIDITTGLSQ